MVSMSTELMAVQAETAEEALFKTSSLIKREIKIIDSVVAGFSENNIESFYCKQLTNTAGQKTIEETAELFHALWNNKNNVFDLYEQTANLAYLNHRVKICPEKQWLVAVFFNHNKDGIP